MNQNKLACPNCGFEEIKIVFSEECDHDWKCMNSIPKIHSYDEKTWSVNNFQCQKCFGLWQTKTLIANELLSVI